MDNNKALEQFKLDVAKFSGNYRDFLIVARNDEQLMWKSTDDTWGVGAAKRYMDVMAERDRLEENGIFESE